MYIIGALWRGVATGMAATQRRSPDSLPGDPGARAASMANGGTGHVAAVLFAVTLAEAEAV
jgi:hypothetical protein